MNVSVVIPAYNHSGHIQQTVDSVFAQSFAEYETIVVNDGSTDDTGEVLRPLAKSGRIKYIEQANAGQAAARNRGFEQSTGEFVLFLDDDDLLVTSAIDDLLRGLSGTSRNAVAVVGQCESFGTDGATISHSIAEKHLELPELLLANRVVSPGQCLIRRDALVAIGGFGKISGGADDWDCWIRLRELGPIAVIPSVVLRHRLHEGNASRFRIKMLSSERRVATAHTSRHTVPSRQQSIRRLLEGSASAVAEESISSFWRGDIKRGLAGMWCLFDCAIAAYFDLGCLKKIAKAFRNALLSGA